MYETAHSPRYMSSDTTTVLKVWLWRQITHDGRYAIKQKSHSNKMKARTCCLLLFSNRYILMTMKIADKIPYLGSNISSIETDINISIKKALTTIAWLSIIRKFHLSYNLKRDFGRVELTRWMQKLDYNKMLRKTLDRIYA